MAFRIEDIELGDDTGPLAELVACWRASVEATHTFLTPDDIERIATYVPDAIASVAHLAVCRDENGQVVGFIGVDGTMIEMLFIHPSLRGCGLGSLLLDHAVSEHGATLVDVNEQNGRPSASTGTTASRCSTARKPTAWATPSPSCICACALLPTGQLDHMARVNHR